MNRKTQIFIGLALLVMFSVSGAACIDSNDDDQDDLKITINGQEFTINELFLSNTQITVTGSDGKNYTGISLSNLMNTTGLNDAETKQYNIAASDGYNKNVTWADLQLGVLVKEDTMTAFPHLPGKYRITDVIRIEPVNISTFMVNGWLYTWDQPFDKLDEKIVEDNESNSYEGVPLSDLLNDTGIENPDTHNFTITASDDYSKEFTWDDMMNGILVKDEHKSVFPEKDKKFWIKDIARIEVV